MSTRSKLILFIGICSVLCFAKRNFEIIIERAEISDLNTEIALAKCSINKYNRTCKTFNVNFTVLKNVSDLHVEIQGFAMFSNEYRPVPVVFKRSVCDLLRHEFLWVKSELVKTSNIPTQCPFTAGDYYVKDFVPNGDDIPAAANFPWTKVMLRLRFLSRDKGFGTLKLYLTLDHDAELKRVG